MFFLRGCSSHPFTWKSYLWVTCDGYFCQGLCCFDFAHVCIVRCQWDQSLCRRKENVNHANLLKQSVYFGFQVKLSVFIRVLYLSSTLCHHCASVFLFFHQSQEDPAMRNGIKRKSTEETVSRNYLLLFPYLEIHSLQASVRAGLSCLTIHTNADTTPASSSFFSLFSTYEDASLTHGKTDRFM